MNVEMHLPFVAADKETAARSVGLSTKSLESAVTSGDLVAHWFNTKPLFLAEDLHAWISSLPTDKPKPER